VLGVAAGRFYASSLGEDSVATYWALRREAVLFDVAEKPWQIEGPDVVAFLEKLFARQISNLPTGRGRYAIACTSEGGTYRTASYLDSVNCASGMCRLTVL
jgi:glycine cleavage system aminomethyltransferase T